MQQAFRFMILFLLNQCLLLVFQVWFSDTTTVNLMLFGSWLSSLRCQSFPQGKSTPMRPTSQKIRGSKLSQICNVKQFSRLYFKLKKLYCKAKKNVFKIKRNLWFRERTSSNIKYTQFIVHVQKHWYDPLTATLFLRKLYIQTGYAVIVGENWLCISNEKE